MNQKYTTKINEKVTLDIGEIGIAAIPPITIPELFNETCKRYENQLALSTSGSEISNQNYTNITYNQYHRIVYQTAKAFIKLGLKQKDGIGILAFNCPEWFYAELGGIFAGGIIAGIYTTNSPEAVENVLASSDCVIAIVDDSHQMAKIQLIKSKLPKLKVIIQIHGPYHEYIDNNEYEFYKWSDIEEMDTSSNLISDELDKRIKLIAPNECCCLIYTSGTTGQPKAAMLSHDNLIWSAASIIETFTNITYGDEVFVSYLPLNHIAAQLLDIYIPIHLGACVHFADRNAFKGSLIKTLARTRPTRFIGVPRVWEKFHEQLLSKESELNCFMRFALNATKSTIQNYHQRNIHQGYKTYTKWAYQLASTLIHNIKVNMGLDRCRQCLVGAAPTSSITKLYFLSIDIRLIDVLGMTEGGGITASDHQASLESIGKPMAGVQIKILHPDETGNGEICIKSRGVFMGYLNELDKTEAAFDTDGWLKSGDLGYINDKGYAYITGRLKEIIITAGGENVAPVNIENIVKYELPFISNAILCGDAKKYLTILLTIKTKMNPETGDPTNQLQLESLELMKSLNLKYTTITEICEAGPCPIVVNAIQIGINRYNAVAISNAQKIQKFTILPNDFSNVTGELGPTLKLNRGIIHKNYQKYIQKMYTE